MGSSKPERPGATLLGRVTPGRVRPPGAGRSLSLAAPRNGTVGRKPLAGRAAMLSPLISPQPEMPSELTTRSDTLSVGGVE